jgi:hypothetical protein
MHYKSCDYKTEKANTDVNESEKPATPLQIYLTQMGYGK